MLYDELVPFYHLLDPLEDHSEEGQEFGDVLLQAVHEATHLLELGSGAGHGAYYVKKRFESVTLTDISEQMLERSRQLNPDCEHLVGDMRTVRLGRTFDCILIHDAITYIATRADLLQVGKTVAAHLRPGGAALLIPDCVKESFVDGEQLHSADDGTRSIRCVEWSHDPDPDDETQVVDFAFLLREGGEVRCVHDRHIHGLFETKTWLEILDTAGLEVELITRPLPNEVQDSGYTDKMFLCRTSQ